MEQGVERAELDRVDVLELVDERLAETPALRRAEHRVVAQRGRPRLEQVVEVDEPAFRLPAAVVGERLGHDGRVDPTEPIGPLGGRGELVGAEATSTGPCELGSQVVPRRRGEARAGARRGPAPMSARRGRCRPTVVVGSLAELPERDGVEGAHRGVADPESGQPDPELSAARRVNVTTMMRLAAVAAVDPRRRAPGETPSCPNPEVRAPAGAPCRG